MRLSASTLTPRQVQRAQAATASRAQAKRLKGRRDRLESRSTVTSSSDRISTFPKQFEGLRDRLFERAKQTPEFLVSVFTTIEGQTPTDDEILKAVEHRLFTIIHTYPFWFGQLPIDKITQPRQATPAQLEALAKARAARASEATERELRLQARIASEPSSGE